MGEDHDEPLHVWQASVSEPANGPHLPCGYIVVGDNIDKRIVPRNMRVEHQVQSLHYFHAYAALNRVKTLHLDDSKQIGDIKRLPLSTFLLSPEDCSTLRDNYVITYSRSPFNCPATIYLMCPAAYTTCQLCNNESEVHCGKTVCVCV